jgi:DNA topoisomerase-1
VGKPLIIVESPAKAKTITKFLGKGYVVESSIGHIRDLPSRADEIPAAYRKRPWARTGVDIENGFKPLYIVPVEKRAHVKKLRDLVAHASELYLATDEDREGEAIAWHLREVLDPKVPVRRMVFHEITEKAIKQALEHPRAINEKLVDAQEARRILDRLYGYEVSPVLWRKVAQGLSAGRVQSVATRLVVERERARLAFKSGAYASVSALVQKRADETIAFGADLAELGGRRIARGNDFDPKTGQLSQAARDAKVLLLEPAIAEKVARALTGDVTLEVTDVTRRPFTQRPPPPFITSTLQQEAGRKLRFTAQRTMRVAQRLYESGYITYMRTDSTTLSEEAIRAARKQVTSLFGASFLPAEPRVHANKVKGAQEAHEAIRPAGDTFRTPEELRGELDEDGGKLYELIWKRTVASQMKDATGERTQVRMSAPLGRAQDGTTLGDATLSASGQVLHFAGFLRAYVEGSDDPEAELEDREKLLPALSVGEALRASKADPRSHATQPPARYTEASLVKEMEERGIGRPSTYATIIQTVQDRGYVFKKGGALVPTFTAFAVTNLLERHFGDLVDYAFTARMEDDLDSISSGERPATPWLQTFYFGGAKVRPENVAEASLADVGLKAKLESGVDKIDARDVCSMILGTTPEGESVAVRVGRYGPYVQIEGSERRANIPTDLAPDELDVALATRLLTQADQGNRALGQHPTTGENVYVKTGRYGPYVQLGEPEVTAKGALKKGTKPRMASLWPGMSVETLSLEQALLLLSFPKVLGKHPVHGVDVLASDGQFGPYVTFEVDGKRDSRSLDGHVALATVTLDEALRLFAQPRERRGRGAAQGPLAELGTSPVTKKPIVVRRGKFGAYVTDGEVNATIPATKEPSTLTLDDALELIAAREQRLRERGEDPRAPKPEGRGRPGARKPTRRAPARAAATETHDGEPTSDAARPTKKAGAKTPSAKAPPAKKAAAKKAPAKKAPAKKAPTKKSGDEKASAKRGAVAEATE